MSVYKKTVLEYDPTVRVSDKTPKVTVFGHTLVRIQRSKNDGVDVTGDSRKQTITILKNLKTLIEETVAHLEDQTEESV